MRVLSVASELFPLIKTGGLADVAGALPAALGPLGIEMRPLLPAYPSVQALLDDDGRTVAELDGLPGGPGRLRRAPHAGRPLYLLDAPALFGRPGNPYGGPGGVDWPDNGLRFGALAWAAAALGRGADAGWRPAIVHAMTGAGLAPAYLALGCVPGSRGQPAGCRPGRDDRAQSGFSGAVLPALLGPLDLRPRRSRWPDSNIMAASAFSWPTLLRRRLDQR
jgi:starch synthase